MDNKRITIELTPLNIELIQRFANDRHNPENPITGLEWIASGLTQVTTATAFQLARGGREVFMVYADGTDSQLDDIEHESEYYPDKTKSYPDIETIFVVEGEL